MVANRNTLVSSIIATVMIFACSGVFTLPGQITPTIPPEATSTPYFSATVPPSPATSTPTFSTVPPTNTLTPVYIPNPHPIRQTFIAKDGRQLIGYFYPAWKPNAPVVVLMHSYGSNQTWWHESSIIKWLQNWPVPMMLASPTPSASGRLPTMSANLSFAVFTFDFRGHGESLPDNIIEDGFRKHANGLLMDATSGYQAASQMLGVDPTKMIGLGASIGADAVVDTCGEGCVGAFSISPGSWLKVDYARATRKLIADGKPVRCMYAVKDKPSPNTCMNIKPGNNYKIFAYPGEKHGMTFIRTPQNMEADFGTNLLDFLLEAIQ